jgi:5-methylcytosine-specific restriction endonuclease McrA
MNDSTSVNPSCYYCGNLLSKHPSADLSHRLSRDHILPRVRFNRQMRLLMNTGTFQNFRPSCVRCNCDRANAGHCPGAMMAARATPDGLKRLHKAFPSEISRKALKRARRKARLCLELMI